MTFTTRALAAVGTATVALSFAAPAMAETTFPVAPKLPASVQKLATNLPAMPAAGASQAEIEAWMARVVKSLGLPPLPTENSSDAEAYAFVSSVVKMLGLPAMPAMNAPDSSYDAWIAKVAATFGLPKPPSANASEAAWEAWFTKLAAMAGVDTSALPKLPTVPNHATAHHKPHHMKPGHHATALPSKPAVPVGPAVQTDYVPSSHGSNALPAGAAAAVLAGAGLVVVARRRATR